MENIPSIFSFPAVIYNKLEPYNQVISKARVRIFYKGLNRNNTYITDEFAQKLLSTLSYTPICGIYDKDSKDYTDHGETRDLAKAYGVVPEDHNFKWEIHLDEDGVEREYACADVLLWTSRYKEASEIIDKGQSMELYSNSIQGVWKYTNGKKIFEFTDGCFIGLTPLGDKVEPCFEGAAFYGLSNSLQELVKELQNYNIVKKSEKGGNKEMTINFKLSDSEKAYAIFNLLNPNFNEENGYEVSFGIIDVYEDYAYCYNYEEQKHYRVYYTKDDEKNEVVLGEKEPRFEIDVSESEYSSLMALRALHNDSFEKINESYSLKENTINDLNGTIEGLNNTINEVNNRINQIEIEKENLSNDNFAKCDEINSLNSKIEELNSNISTLNQEKENLSTYKLEKEREEKRVILSKFSKKLDKEFLDSIDTKIDDYSCEELKKELAVALVDATPSLFSNMENNYISNSNFEKEYEEGSLSPAAQLLNKRRKKTNKE